jgi:8-oxo-dGTP pyrophosphatase MutT (NUDIX family)
MITFSHIHRSLANRNPIILPPQTRSHAAVALILRNGVRGPEILFIRRAKHVGDPWSGDFGFPGGKFEEEDGEARRTAERETWEEIGIDLSDARFLGRLDDISGAHLPVVISCFVYLIDHIPSLILSPEVSDAFWFALTDLFDPNRHVEAAVIFGEEKLRQPAIRLLDSDETVLWGITYRLVWQFLQIIHPGVPHRSL